MRSQVDGMNCIGPTARSHVVSSSSRPPSVSWIFAVLLVPSRGMPMIFGRVSPLEETVLPPYCPWLDSTRPIAAISVQSSLHEAFTSAMTLAALRYASIAADGSGELRSEAGVAFALSKPANGAERD